MQRVVMIGGVLVLLLGLSEPGRAGAASGFADPAFQQQWNTGEALAPNFWGPLMTARDSVRETYNGMPNNQRLVQYFDKGRMELRPDGRVTNGLLATELIKGQLQIGDVNFQALASPAISIAGEADNLGPTYATLGTKDAVLFEPSPNHVGGYAQALVSPTGDISVSNVPATAFTTFSTFDDTTKHNVPAPFATYRSSVGVLTIGFALCEPFTSTVKVAGQPRPVLIQVFERRVLTYTDSNPNAFKVEMGNIGQHYYQWRYGTGAVSLAALPTTAAPVTVVTPTGRPVGATAVPLATVAGSGQSPGDLYNCADFASQAAAQAYLRMYPDDPSHLDADHTGIACQSNRAPKDLTPVPRG